MEAALASAFSCRLRPSRSSFVQRSSALETPRASARLVATAFLPSCLSLRLLPGVGFRSSGRGRAVGVKAALEALIFDCDGVILESEDLHRRAYNATFQHFNVTLLSASAPVEWTSEFYDQLQNQIGGGKPKMRWYFNLNGWPSSSVSAVPPETEADRERLIDVLQDWKTEKYKDFIRSGTVETRPGVLRLMDDARAAGKKLAVCSAATKSSVVFCLTNLLGEERFGKLDCFLAGDDVDKKKPDPSIYIAAAEKLGVSPENSLVVEDSVIGLQAASGAGMGCIVSFTSSTSQQDFSTAKAVYPDLGNVSLNDLDQLFEAASAAV